MNDHGSQAVIQVDFLPVWPGNASLILSYFHGGTMNCRSALFIVFLLVLAGCVQKALPPVEFVAPERIINYQDEVRPILVKRCVVCHSCYNSPCQLKLSSFEGLDRGATKKKVYDSSRLQTMEPTRLFTDATTTSEWRARDFFSVTENKAGCGQNSSIMMQLLAHKKTNPMQHGDEFHPEDKDLTCASSEDELGAYLKKHPNRGMPFGFPPLSEKEFTLIAGWLSQGARGPVGDQLQELYAVPMEDQVQIGQWETFFNGEGPKSAMTARYLYEHLFLAHIKFDTQSNYFYELVRSRTGPGEDIDIIATELPYDDPGKGPMYYRFRKIHSTIVHKTHMVFELNDTQLKRFRDLFIDVPWLTEPALVGYDKTTSANPFRAFEQIPPRSRYLFLLDNIHYIIMTFIRGPVCKGQVALNVIRDHFWLLFLDPDHDLSVKFPGFLKTYGKYLEMPLVEENDFRLAKTLFSRKYRKKSSEFVAKRRDFYASHYRYQEVGAKAIWRGREGSDAPLLTVFRHFDSASVHEGPLGYLPRTVWVFDYPLIERVYYSLVAGFNVYGSAVHQLATRVYMDELRQEGETNFLDFMPQPKRAAMMKEWYGGMDLEKTKLDYAPSDLDAAFPFRTNDPKREFLEHLVSHHFLPELELSFDRNYLYANEVYPEIPQTFATFDDYVQGFKAVARPGISFFTKVDDHDANLAYVRIKVNGNEADDVYLSMVINRWHDDVTTLFGEKLKLRPENDSAVFIKGFVGSYPNYFFEVELDDVREFLLALRDYTGCGKSVARLNRFGVNRADDRFWEVYDRFQERFNISDPVLSGVFDLNRYFHLAMRRDQM